MLNSYTNNRFNFNVNAVSGTLRKSHPKSQFVIAPVDSTRTSLFDPVPKFSYKEIIVLQTMLAGDGKCIVEIVNKSDFEEDA